MRLLSLLCALLLPVGVAAGQTNLNRLRIAEALDGWIYLFSYNSTSYEAEFIQGFPTTHFGNLGFIDGVYAGLYDKNPSTPEKYEIFIRQSDSTGKKPDMVSTPLFQYAGVTKAGGTTAAWVSERVAFKAPVKAPPGLLWIGVKVDKQISSTDHLQYAGLNKHGVGTIFGVEPKPGVTNDYAFYCQYTGGKPGTLLQTDYAWVWNTGILTRKPVLQVYSVCNVDRGSGQYMAPMNTNDYSLGGMWPDLVNATNNSPPRKDDIGWRILQAEYKTGNVQWAFIFLSDRRISVPTPYGEWILLFGGPFWTISPLFSPMGNGQWETTPLPIPPEARVPLLGTALYSQTVVAELDKNLTILKVEMSNMAAFHF